MTVELTPALAAALAKKKADYWARRGGAKEYMCLNCGHREMAKDRPAACPACSKVTHERDRK